MRCPVCEQMVMSLIFDPLPASIKGKHSCICRDCLDKIQPQSRNQSASVQGCDSFNPHYDVQLGQHFNSREERHDYLTRKGLKSYGTDSPRESTKTRIICSKTQASNGERGGKI